LHVTDDWLVLTTLREMRELIYPALLSNSITDPTVPSTSQPLVQYHPRGTSRDLWPWVPEDHVCRIREFRFARSRAQMCAEVCRMITNSFEELSPLASCGIPK